MDQTGEPEEVGEQPDAVLPYEAPRTDRPEPSSPHESAAGAGGCLLSVVAIPVGVVATFIAAYDQRWSGATAFCVIGVVFAVPLAAGMAMRSSRRWRAMGAGLLIGVGLAALIEGICFAAAVMK